MQKVNHAFPLFDTYIVCTDSDKTNLFSSLYILNFQLNFMLQDFKILEKFPALSLPNISDRLFIKVDVRSLWGMITVILTLHVGIQSLKLTLRATEIPVK